MNTHEAEEFTEMYIACCEVSGKNFNKTIMLMYVKALEKSNFQSIKKAMSAFFEESKFPSIVDIRSRIGEKVDSPEEQARLLADKLDKAIRNFGWNQEKEAKEHFGEDWDIVTSSRNWADLCSFEDEDPLGYYLHQFRASALILIKQKRGEQIKRESLPSGDIIDVEAFAIVDDQIKTLLSSMDRT
jgi:hypothetical protein